MKLESREENEVKELREKVKNLERDIEKTNVSIKTLDEEVQ